MSCEHPRRVAGLVVERREVVVVVLHLGALDDPVAEADEDVLDLAPGPGQRMEVAERAPAASPATSRRSPRRRAGGRARRPRACRAPPASRASSSPRAWLPALPTGPRSSGGSSAIPRGSSSARPSGPGSGPGSPRARRRPAPPRSRSVPRSRSSSIRSSMILSRSPRRPPNLSAAGAIAAAAATFSDSAPGPQRDRGGRVAALDHLVGEPLALRSEAERRRAPSAAIASSRSPPPAAVSARRGAGVDSGPSRRGGLAKIAPIVARTAFGE